MRVSESRRRLVNMIEADLLLVPFAPGEIIRYFWQFRTPVLLYLHCRGQAVSEINFARALKSLLTLIQL